jgi:hypothetical protein
MGEDAAFRILRTRELPKDSERGDLYEGLSSTLRAREAPT